MNLVFTRSDTLYPATKRPSAIIYTRHVHKNTASFTTRVVNVKTLVLADRLGIYSSDPFSPRGRDFSRNCPGRCTFLACNLSHRLTLTYRMSEVFSFPDGELYCPGSAKTRDQRSAACRRDELGQISRLNARAIDPPRSRNASGNARVISTLSKSSLFVELDWRYSSAAGGINSERDEFAASIAGPSLENGKWTCARSREITISLKWLRRSKRRQLRRYCRYSRCVELLEIILRIIIRGKSRFLLAIW